MTLQFGPDAWLATYGAYYGRMCVLATQAISAGISSERVRIAMSGGPLDLHPYLDRIRWCRPRMATLIKQAEVCGVSHAAIVDRQGEIRRAISAEWGVTIPEVESA